MSINLDALALPQDLFWSDEFDWTPVVQRQSRTEAGALVLEESPRINGRPITLEGGDGFGWASRQLVGQLQNLQQEASADPMTLTIHGVEYTVVWRREDSSSPMTARPVRGPISNPDVSEPYSLVLRFLTV
jgi:hypothetical protein